MIKIQQGFFILLLATFCSTSYAVAPTPSSATAPQVASSPAATAPQVAPAPVTTTQSATTDKTTTTDEAVKATDAPANDSTASTAADTSNPVYADIPIDTPTETKDPYEGFNRAMFSFNETIDKYAMKPIGKGYNAIMPKPLNQGIHNFFNNLGTLPTLANDLLQFNFYQAANDTWRILINSTVGVGGLFDIAARMGLKYYTNDFGLTMAAWGYENSNYLVLPFFGPSTPRDGVGIPVDYFAFSIYPYIYPQSTRYQVYGLGVVDRRAQLLKFQEVLDEASLDKYVFIRNAYLQRRAHQIEENKHLSYADRESSQPIAETSGEIQVADTAEATAEPIQPSDQPIEEGEAANSTAEKKSATSTDDKVASAAAEKKSATSTNDKVDSAAAVKKPATNATDKAGSPTAVKKPATKQAVAAR